MSPREKRWHRQNPRAYPLKSDKQRKKSLRKEEERWVERQEVVRDRAAYEKPRHKYVPDRSKHPG